MYLTKYTTERQNVLVVSHGASCFNVQFENLLVWHLLILHQYLHAP